MRPVEPEQGGVGCRPLLITLSALLVFAAAAVTAGLSMALADDPSPVAERVGLSLYGAGAPISALFAAIAGQLPLAPLTDIVVWVVAAGVSTRWAERRGTTAWRAVATVIGLALVYGFAVASFLERV